MRTQYHLIAIAFTLMLLSGLSSCNDEPYPQYNEGELLWQVTELPVWYSIPEMGPILLPDETHLIYSNINSPKINLVNIKSGQVSLISSFGYAADLSPDAQWIAFNSSYGIISKIKVNGDSLTKLSALSSGGDFSPTWSPDGKSIVYVHHGNSNAEPGGLWQISNNFNDHKYIASSGGVPDFFPDGKRIISSKVIGQSIWRKFFIHDIESGQEINVLDATVNESNLYPKVSPDGQSIVYWNPTGIYVMKEDGSGVHKILPYKHFYETKKGELLGFIAEHPSWHPDGKHIVYQHFAFTEYYKCPENMACTFSESFKGIVSIRKLKVK